MNDQKTLWDMLHEKGKVDHPSDKSTKFAEEVQNIIPPQSKILELGCGVGNDSFYFAQNGHQVRATDFSKVAIENNKKSFKENNLQFEFLDMSNPMEFSDNSFDVVYARLSLHYFSNLVTRNIFREIHRVLKHSGILCFICKSTKDPLYGKGKQIEKDMFEINGHVRHFFSSEYIKECLTNLFNIEKLEIGEDKFYDSNSAFIKVIAKSLK